jgi:hypothetical protein
MARPQERSYPVLRGMPIGRVSVSAFQASKTAIPLSANSGHQLYPNDVHFGSGTVLQRLSKAQMRSIELRLRCYRNPFLASTR